MDLYITGGMIKRLRENAQMTQSELAEIIGVSDKAVSKWETGRGYPDIMLLEPLARALGVSVRELMSGCEVRNRNISCNMMKSRIYVCPVCMNTIIASGEADISCCGVHLLPAEDEDADCEHEIHISKVEDEIYVEIDHPMTKEHYISFIACVTGDRWDMKRLYPEGNAEARFKTRGTGYIFWYCVKDGLFMQRIKKI